MLILRDKSLMKMEIGGLPGVMVHLNGTFFCTRAAFAEMRNRTTAASSPPPRPPWGVRHLARPITGRQDGDCRLDEPSAGSATASGHTIVPTGRNQATRVMLPMWWKVKPAWPFQAWPAGAVRRSGNIFTAAAFQPGMWWWAGVFFDQPGDHVEMVVEKLDQIKSLKAAEVRQRLEKTGYASPLVSI